MFRALYIQGMEKSISKHTCRTLKETGCSCHEPRGFVPEFVFCISQVFLVLIQPLDSAHVDI